MFKHTLFDFTLDCEYNFELLLGYFGDFQKMLIVSGLIFHIFSGIYCKTSNAQHLFKVYCIS